MRKPRSSPKIKICCISSLKEAQVAVKHGANILGLVGAMPSGPGVIDDETIASIARQVPNHVQTYLLSSETSAAAIIAHHKRTRTSGIQLVDYVPPETYPVLRAALPAVELVQVIHVNGISALQEALLVAPWVDRLLLDSGNPNAGIKQLGGTGLTHDWSISRQIVAQTEVPVFLAGGLNHGNVADAIEQVKPFGLDLCTGVRSAGQLDEALLQQFVAAARK